MSKTNPDELILQGSSRSFVQWGGARPSNPMYFAGQGTQYMFIDGVSNPVSGDVTPIRVPHPRVRNAYKLVARSVAPPDLAAATLNFHEKHGAIPRQLMGYPCPFNFYEYLGSCSNLSDKAAGFDDYILVYSRAEPNSTDLGTRTNREGSEPMTDAVGVSLGAIYPVGRITFGESAAATIDAEVRDVVYGTSQRCGSCGAVNDGTLWAYAVYDGIASPAAKARIMYTVDGGSTWTSQDVSSAAAGDVACAIEVVGDMLMVTVVGTTASEIHWTLINSVTGAPGSSWTKITTGFVTDALARDVYVALTSAVYICADNGYIYKATDITAGVATLAILGNGTDDFSRIAGDGDQTIVAVGDGGMVYKSTNAGATWAQTTTSPGVAELTAVAVLDEYRFWVGNASGAIYYTVDGGETWVQSTSAAPSATSVQDIVAATDEVIHVSYLIATPAPKLSSTWNGGETWTQRTPRLGGLPTYTRGNRIAVPASENPAVDANNILIAALDDVADGSIIQGAAAIL